MKKLIIITLSIIGMVIFGIGGYYIGTKKNNHQTRNMANTPPLSLIA